MYTANFIIDKQADPEMPYLIELAREPAESPSEVPLRAYFYTNLVATLILLLRLGLISFLARGAGSFAENAHRNLADGIFADNGAAKIAGHFKQGLIEARDGFALFSQF